MAGDCLVSRVQSMDSARTGGQFFGGTWLNIEMLASDEDAYRQIQAAHQGGPAPLDLGYSEFKSLLRSPQRKVGHAGGTEKHVARAIEIARVRE